MPRTLGTAISDEDDLILERASVICRTRSHGSASGTYTPCLLNSGSAIFSKVDLASCFALRTVEEQWREVSKISSLGQRVSAEILKAARNTTFELAERDGRKRCSHSRF